jgi:hypothetical protein
MDEIFFLGRFDFWRPKKSWGAAGWRGSNVKGRRHFAGRDATCTGQSGAQAA